MGDKTPFVFAERIAVMFICHMQETGKLIFSSQQRKRKRVALRWTALSRLIMRVASVHRGAAIDDQCLARYEIGIL